MPNEAVRAAAAVAARCGMHVGRARVLATNGTTIVDLGGCVARVAPPGLGVEHEVAVASHAFARGGPVVPPASHVDPGPHKHGAVFVSFWDLASTRNAARPEIVGKALRRLHDSLADYPGSLPAFGHSAEAVSRLARLPESHDHAMIREALAFPVTEGQALHGDAAQSNCLADGRWIDFALTASGPPEADLATLVARWRVHRRGPNLEAALTEYGRFDASLVRDYLRLFVALTCVLLLERPVRDAASAGLLGERIAWLRRRAPENDPLRRV